MVKLSLIVEGGVHTSCVSAETANNAEALREALHKFFSRLLGRDDVEITIFMGQSYRNAAKLFVEKNMPIVLFVDLDLRPEEKELWFDKLVNDKEPKRSITIPKEKRQSVFFMVQEMESWFLKQTDCMEKWAKKEGWTKKDKTSIAEHSIIKGKDIEQLSKPSEKLNIIMRHFFTKNNKSAKYGKLKTDPSLLDALDATALRAVDYELQRFYTHANS